MNPDIRDHAYQFFIEEAPELLQVIEEQLLTLRQERTSAKVHDIMRAAHSLKGGAASVELPTIRAIAHRLEDIFKAFYNEAVPLDEDMESLLLQAYDCLKNPLMTQIQTGHFDEEQALNQATPVLEAIEFLLGDNLAAGDQFLPSSADLGVDIVSSLFEVDIVQGLDQIAAALEGGDHQTLQETLALQTEVFGGLAELLNLPGFKAITEAVQMALAQHPDQCMELAQLALQDWRNSCDQVLNHGDRSQGGNPSEALLALSGWSTETLAPEMLDFPQILGNGLGETQPVLEDIFGLTEIAEDFSTVNWDLDPAIPSAPLPFSLPEEDFSTVNWDLDPAIPSPSPPPSLSSSLPSPISPPEIVNTQEPSYQFFIEEAPELLQIIEEGLLTLRSERNAAKVHEIMRAAHSLKGGAASVGLIAIKDLSHRLEDIFKAFYNESVVIDEDLETLLLQAYDCLKFPLIQQMTTGAYDANLVRSSSEPILAAIAAYLGDDLAKGEEYLPSSADLGVDIVASLFEVDIAQGLQQLAEALATHQAADVQTVLATQAEVFGGLGELLNLPGFKAITAAVQQGLKAHPEQVMLIAEQALIDWQNSCDQVLKQGDRTQGGSPSEALLAFGVEEVAKTPLQVQTTPRLSISDLFGGEEEEPEEPEAVLTMPEVVETQIELENAALEDIFSTLPTEDMATSPEVSFEGIEFPPLADVESLAISGTEEVIEEVSTSSTPDLEAVFGGLIPDSSVLEETVFADLDQIPSMNEGELTAMVQSVEQVFEQLPQIEELPAIVNGNGQVKAAPPSVEVIPPLESKVTAPNVATATPANLSIRVDFQRLERMNNWVGELAINRNSLSLQNEQLQASVRNLLSRFSRFQGMTNKLRQLSDQLVIMPDRSGTLRVRRERTAWIANAFDSLEMDSYGALSGQLQEILEEMMQLEEAVDDIVLFARTTDQGLEQQRQMLFSLRDELMWARMLPLGEVLNRFPRVLRDMATKYHKPVQLKLYGTAVLVDRLALEKLYDPLLHLLRNAFDHGIEPAQMRLSQGKPETGTIELRAYHQGNQTFIELEDDGGGLDVGRITEQAIEKKLITEGQAKSFTPEQIQNLIFEPNFSTASQVSELSGRGVGLDVVRQQLQSLKGNVSVSSRPGKGTTFTLRLPLTLTIAKLLVCLISQDNYRTNTAIAIPSDSVAELMVPRSDQLKTSGGQRFLIWQQQMIPIYPLAHLLSYNYPLVERQASRALMTVPQPEDWNLPLILLKRGNHYYALEVNRLVTEQELVVKPFAPVMSAPDYLYGCTILGDGTLLPVVNGGLLLEWYWGQGTDGIMAGTTSTTDLDGMELDTMSLMPEQPPMILVVDDSAALRRTLALTLEKSGYRVLQAKDGQEALETLHQTSGIELVICDVEMPNLNGFEFLGQRRRNPEMMQIPVAMLTSRGSEKHRQLAMQLGASAYFTKPYIEQQFLIAIKDLLQRELVNH
ncbi:MAG: Hpt domain-containing protein [Snowella sp.]|nr:Hpt domain-containing protein [Snowella sp.]